MPLVPRYTDCKECAKIAKKLQPFASDDDLEEIKSTLFCFHTTTFASEVNVTDLFIKLGNNIPRYLSRDFYPHYLAILEEYINKQITTNRIELQIPFKELLEFTIKSIESEFEYSYNTATDENGITKATYDLLKAHGISKEDLISDNEDMKTLTDEIGDRYAIQRRNKFFQENNVTGYISHISDVIRLFSDNQAKQAYIDHIKKLVQSPEFLKTIRIGSKWSNPPNVIYNNHRTDKKKFIYEVIQTLEKQSKLIGIGDKGTEMTIKQIALLCIYSGIQVTRENSNEIVEKFKHNSGEKLFLDYTFFLSPANRKAKPFPFTLKKLKNKISLFESILPYLEEAHKQRLLDELHILKNYLKTETE